jgi:hypothetical protein
LCYDEITVNDMRTNLACAWSGALVLFGGLGAVMWVFNRSLSLHLQICWQIIPGKKYFYGAQIVGWGIPALLLGVALGLSGVSFRFGNVCHINHDNSLGTFWGPILSFAALAAILQFITLGYCIRVYLRNLWDPNSASGASSSMPSQVPTFTASSTRTKSARATYRRVRKVIALQWRGVVVVMIVLVSAVYFAIIFQIFDNMSQSGINDPLRVEEWVLCLVTHGGEKTPCLELARNFTLAEPIVAAVLFLLALMGYWCLLFLGRLSMFVGWWELIRRPFLSHDHFVSVDARRISDPRNYEMLTSPPQTYHMTKAPEGGLVATAKPATLNTIPLNPLNKEFLAQTDDSPSDYFPSSPPPARQYENRSMSFSQPRPPTRSNSQQRVTFSREEPSSIQTNLNTRPSNPYSPVTQPAAVVTSPRTAGIGASPVEQSDPYFQRNASAMSQSSVNQLRSASAMSASHNRSGSALGREWPTPAPRPSQNSPTPYRSNSRAGTGSALGSRAVREWDPTSTYARGMSQDWERNA